MCWSGVAIEDMTSGMTAEAALRADGVRSNTDAMSVILEEPAVARTKLGQSNPLTPRECSLSVIHGRGTGSQEMVGTKIVDGGEDGV